MMMTTTTAGHLTDVSSLNRILNDAKLSVVIVVVLFKMCETCDPCKLTFPVIAPCWSLHHPQSDLT